MTALSRALGIPPAAAPAWVALTVALDRLADRGRKPVCERRPDDWSADARPAVRRDAVVACTFCPLLDPCRDYADLADERHGVWGGQDRTDHRAPRRDAA